MALRVAGEARVKTNRFLAQETECTVPLPAGVWRLQMGRWLRTETHDV